MFVLDDGEREQKRERVLSTACSPLYVVTGLPLEVALHSGSFSGLLQVQVAAQASSQLRRGSASRYLQAGALVSKQSQKEPTASVQPLLMLQQQQGVGR